MKWRMRIFAVVLFAMVVYTVMHATWSILTTGWSTWHLFWIALGAFGHYAIMHVYAVRKHDAEQVDCGSKTDSQLIDYIELQRDIERAHFGNDRS